MRPTSRARADGAGGLLRRLKPLYAWLRVVFADSVYHRVAALLACFPLGLTLVVVGRLAGAEGFVAIPRRWVVERTIGRLGRWRRLSADGGACPPMAAPVRRWRRLSADGGACPPMAAPVRRWRRLSKGYEELPEVSEAIAQRSAGGKHGGAVPGHLGHDPPPAPPPRPPKPQASRKHLPAP